MDRKIYMVPFVANVLLIAFKSLNCNEQPVCFLKSLTAVLGSAIDKSVAIITCLYEICTMKSVDKLWKVVLYLELYY